MTEEQEASITMTMRVLEVFQKYPAEVLEIPGLKEQVELLKETVEEIFAVITDEEKDYLLERYKEELEWLKNNS